MMQKPPSKRTGYTLKIVLGFFFVVGLLLFFTASPFIATPFIFVGFIISLVLRRWIKNNRKNVAIWSLEQQKREGRGPQG